MTIQGPNKGSLAVVLDAELVKEANNAANTEIASYAQELSRHFEIAAEEAEGSDTGDDQ